MKKRWTAMLLALVMALSLVPAAFAADLAKASTQSVEVDGTKIEFQMYALVDANGGLTNYVKLRDVAHVLNSTPAKFSVGYDGMISITTGESYTDNGSEMTTPYSGDRAYKPGPGSVKVNGADVNLDAIVLTDDNGGAYTYFKLRDLGTALGFTVDWTGERGVFIETGAAPTESAVPADDEKLTLEKLQGTWLFPGGDWDSPTEYTFTGDQVKCVMGGIRGDSTYVYYTASVSLENDTPYSGTLKLSNVKQYTVTNSGSVQPVETPRSEELIRSYTANKMTDGHTRTFQRIDQPRLDREMMSVIDAAAAKREEMESKYPSYEMQPGVPDLGAIFGLEADYDDMLYPSYSYKWDWRQCDYDPTDIVEQYIKILEECGFVKATHRTIHSPGNKQDMPLTVTTYDKDNLHVVIEELYSKHGVWVTIQ